METVIFTCGISNYAEMPLLSTNQVAEIFQIVVLLTLLVTIKVGVYKYFISTRCSSIKG